MNKTNELATVYAVCVAMATVYATATVFGAIGIAALCWLAYAVWCAYLAVSVVRADRQSDKTHRQWRLEAWRERYESYLASIEIPDVATAWVATPRGWAETEASDYDAIDDKGAEYPRVEEAAAPVAVLCDLYSASASERTATQSEQLAELVFVGKALPGDYDAIESKGDERFTADSCESDVISIPMPIPAPVVSVDTTREQQAEQGPLCVQIAACGPVKREKIKRKSKPAADTFSGAKHVPTHRLVSYATDLGNRELMNRAGLLAYLAARGEELVSQAG
jgi:hypothetical protein